MPACNHCGHHVSTDFKRVFGDGQGQVIGCPTCDLSPLDGGR